MKNTSGLRFKTAIFKGAFIHNPVLTQIIGICPIVAIATSLKNGLAVALSMTALLVINESFTSLLLKSTPRWVRLCFYTVISGLSILVISPLSELFFKETEKGAGIYIYLLCANALTVIRCEKFASKTGVRNSVVDALACGIGYGFIALIVGTVREFLNYGTLFSDSAVGNFSVVNSPFFALLILGFLAAIHRFIVLRYFPGELADTFFMNKIWEKPVLKDPGISLKKKKPSLSEESVDSIRPRHDQQKEEQEGGK